MNEHFLRKQSNGGEPHAFDGRDTTQSRLALSSQGVNWLIYLKLRRCCSMKLGTAASS